MSLISIWVLLALLNSIVFDLAFEMGPMEGLTAQEVKDYIRFIANRRLIQLGLEPIYDVQKNIKSH